MFPDAASREERRLRSFRTGSVGKDPHGDAPERRGPLVVVLPQPEPGNELGLAQQQLNSAHFLFHVSKDPADVRKSSGGPTSSSALPCHLRASAVVRVPGWSQRTAACASVLSPDR